MSRRLVISALPGETRAALIEDGRLAEITIRRADRPSHLGSLYHGRVAKVDKSLDAAFVELRARTAAVQALLHEIVAEAMLELPPEVRAKLQPRWSPERWLK